MATLSETYKVILGVGGVTGTIGTGRNDTQTFLTTTLSDHYYEGLGGNDTITGTLADDYIEGGAGADTFVELGLGVNDTLGYLNSDAGVTVTLNNLGGLSVAQGGHATGDVSVGTLLVGFENLVGSEFNDTLTGNAGANKLLGMGGDDTINGGGGNDVLYGGDGVDTIHGDAGDDKIYGEAGDDKLFGDDGNDTFYYSRGFNKMFGGNGTDTVDYSASPGDHGGATINLKTGKGDHDALGDEYDSIENVFGTEFNDHIWGNASANTMDGKGGRDTFFYASVADLNGDRINAFSDNQGDKIDLRELHIGFGNIQAANTSGDNSVVYTITDDGQTGFLTVQFLGVGVPGTHQVFDL
ncbi:calcium-binding protein [Candidatus Phyllobacterium onerii]|uniref:calcium-binding protein n=1 Tax=Candidatus Phyllobacterium onerii TaxID=3020828 RepID=UPI0023303A02|nr:calcium-binding protein [Phyllobacterium sp. IY22]